MYRRNKLTRMARALTIAASLAVSLVPLHAQSVNAVVLTQAGQVSVMKDPRGLAEPLYVGDAVKPQWIVVTGPDSYAQFQVSDGSTFEVFSNTRMVFRPSLGNWQNLLDVWIGRVKVFIQHAPGVPNPNQVSSPTAVISVRGTVFDVVVEDDDGTTQVTVDEGVVGVRNLTAYGDGVTLTQGQVVRVYRNVPLAKAQLDKGNLIRIAFEKARQAAILLPRSPGGGGPVAGVPGTGGAQGDKGTKGGGTTTGPGAPTSGPGAPSGGPGAPSGGPGSGPGGG